MLTFRKIYIVYFEPDIKNPEGANQAKVSRLTEEHQSKNIIIYITSDGKASVNPDD